MKVDICIIGAGSGGLSVAAGAAQLGLKTVLIEAGEMGGDCLNTGCVPSKALLAAAKRAEMHRKSNIKGIAVHEPEIDFAKVKDHVFDTINTIAPHDSQERFEGLGCTVIREFAKFVDENTVQAGEHSIQAKYFVIATGSKPFIPEGFNESEVLTNETVFELREKPEHLVIVGGGPIGVEMAQAHRRLGSKVTLLARSSILSKDDPKNVAVVRQTLLEEGVEIKEHADINEAKTLGGSHILVATGRMPAIAGLELEKAGVEYTEKGVTVDARLRTSNKKVFAIGDVSGAPKFTHMAGYHAGIIIRNVCFKIPAKVDYKALPRVTYTDPEVAQVGLTEQEARRQYGDSVQIVEAPFSGNDRAIAEGSTKGQLRLVLGKKGKILGASMAGAHAGDLIQTWVLAISSGLKLSAITGMIAPYPTLGEINKRAAGAYYTPSLFSKKTQWVVRLLQLLPF